MASTYEFLKTGNRSPVRTLSGVSVDLELLNNKIIQTLLDLGLTGDEAKVLLFMNKKGEMKAAEIAKNVEIPRTRLYYVLESLEGRGLIVSTIQRPAKYRAIPLGKAVDFLIDSYRCKLYSLEKAKEVIFNDWSSLQQYEVVKNSALEPEDNLQFISGQHRIYSKAENIIMDAAKEVIVFVNVRNLAKLSFADITDKLQLLASNGVTVKILTNASLCDESLLEEIDRCTIREIPADFNDKVHFIIVDNKEMLLLHLDKEEPSSMWTNSGSLVDAMSFLFAVGWRSASTFATAKKNNLKHAVVS